MTTTEEAKKIQPKTYYSSSPTYVLRIARGMPTINAAGVATLVGEKIVEFMPFGKFGRLMSNDPETIERLDEAVASGSGDIFALEEMERRSTTVDQKLELAETKTRLLTEENALLRKLADELRVQKEGKLAKAS